MKKFIIVVISIICIASVFLAKKINSPSSEQYAIDISTAEVNASWSQSELASKIPEPSQYDRCGIVTDNSNLFWAYIYGMPFEEFDAYVNDCRDFGFIDNNYSVGDHLYYGELSNTYGVQLTYNAYKNYMTIQSTSRVNDPDKWKG